jgi:hypothetical protein
MTTSPSDFLPLRLPRIRSALLLPICTVSRKYRLMPLMVKYHLILIKIHLVPSRLLCFRTALMLRRLPPRMFRHWLLVILVLAFLPMMCMLVGPLVFRVMPQLPSPCSGLPLGIAVACPSPRPLTRGSTRRSSTTFGLS